MKILHIIPSLNPAYGGPMEGVKNQGKKLLEMDHTVEVVTLDGPEAPFLQDFPLTVHALGHAKEGYRYSNALVPWLQQNAQNYDKVVVNGIWQYHSFGAWRALRNTQIPYYIYTHGMLDPWFKKQYPIKHLLKWCYWPWAEYRVLRDAKAVIFTCEEERHLAQKSFWLYKANEAVTSYGTATPPQNANHLKSVFSKAFPQIGGKRFLLFLSRIHEKKGCDLLVKAFAKIAGQHPNLHLVMAGPDQSGLVKQLQVLANSLNISDRIYWPGMLTGEVKWGAFHACEAFVLPSHQENFGIVVAEALACSKPVLISNKVNIWREVEDNKVGVVSDDTLLGTVDLLNRWLSLSSEEQVAMAHRAKTTYDTKFTVEAMTKSLLYILNN